MRYWLCPLLLSAHLTVKAGFKASTLFRLFAFSCESGYYPQVMQLKRKVSKFFFLGDGLGELLRINLPRTRVNKASIHAPDPLGWHHGMSPTPRRKTRIGKEEENFYLGRTEHGIG